MGLLSPAERGWGNGVQMAGNYLGAMLGGGVMLVLLNQWGWIKSLLALALMVVVALAPILQHQERLPKAAHVSPAFMDIFNFYRRPGLWRWLMVLTLYVIGGSLADSMFRPLLVDVGLSLADIGWLLGVLGNGASIAGAVVSGLLVVPLGRKRSLITFGVLQTVAILVYTLPASGVSNELTLYLVTIIAHFASGAIFTVSSTVMMDKSHLETAGTDYTAQTSIVYLGSFVAAGMSGVIASEIGYLGLFLVSAAIAFLTVILIAKTLALGY